MLSVFADSSVLIAGSGSKSGAHLAGVDRLLTLDRQDFDIDISNHSNLIIMTPGEFVQEIRTIIAQGLK